MSADAKFEITLSTGKVVYLRELKVSFLTKSTELHAGNDMKASEELIKALIVKVIDKNGADLNWVNTDNASDTYFSLQEFMEISGVLTTHEAFSVELMSKKKAKVKTL